MGEFINIMNHNIPRFIFNSFGKTRCQVRHNLIMNVPRRQFIVLRNEVGNCIKPLGAVAFNVCHLPMDTQDDEDELEELAVIEANDIELSIGSEQMEIVLLSKNIRGKKNINHSFESL